MNLSRNTLSLKFSIRTRLVMVWNNVYNRSEVYWSVVPSLGTDNALSSMYSQLIMLELTKVQGFKSLTLSLLAPNIFLLLNGKKRLIFKI